MVRQNHYDRVLQNVLALDRKGIFLDLKNTKSALSFFKNPHTKFKSILVAGTNGKGSTVAMLTSILCQAGYTVGTYISPHLIDIRERIQINQKNISQSDFVNLAVHIFKMIKKQKLKMSLSFFEFMTVMAFLYFYRKKVDVAVVEVGLGGRFDATNVLNPLISVITTIGLDHQRFLGNTLKKIAYEKGGIIRYHKPLVISVAQPTIRKYLKSLCEEKKSAFHALGENFFMRTRNKGLHFFNDVVSWSELKLSLQGHFQRRNAASALEVIFLLKEEGWEISERVIREGLSKTIWPGRLELIHSEPRILLDGAHNPEGIRALMATLKQSYQYDKLHIIFGVMEDKDYQTMIKHVLTLSDAIYFVEPNVKRALKGETLVQKMPQLKEKVEFYKEEMKFALSQIIKRVGQNDMICITGSLYTVAEAKRVLQ